MNITKHLLNPRLIILITTIILSIFYWLVPPVQDWVSANVSIIQSWEQETNMSGAVLIGLGILVVGSFIYLIYDALKESDSERLEKKIDRIIELLENNNVQSNQSDKPKPNL